MKNDIKTALRNLNNISKMLQNKVNEMRSDFSDEDLEKVKKHFKVVDDLTKKSGTFTSVEEVSQFLNENGIK